MELASTHASSGVFVRRQCASFEICGVTNRHCTSHVRMEAYNGCLNVRAIVALLDVERSQYDMGHHARERAADLNGFALCSSSRMKYIVRIVLVEPRSELAGDIH